MVCSLPCAFFLAFIVGSGAEQRALRGSEAPAASSTQNRSAFTAPHWTNCQCSQGDCQCTRNSSEEAASQEQKALEAALVNKTNSTSAWWEEHGRGELLTCSCSIGTAKCLCGSAAEQPADNETATLVKALRNETERTMSLWWMAGGGFGGHGYHPYQPWGGGGGHYGHAGYGGCACGGGYGCACGHGGYGGW